MLERIQSYWHFLCNINEIALKIWTLQIPQSALLELDQRFFPTLQRLINVCLNFKYFLYRQQIWHSLLEGCYVLNREVLSVIPMQLCAQADTLFLFFPTVFKPIFQRECSNHQPTGHSVAGCTKFLLLKLFHLL